MSIEASESSLSSLTLQRPPALFAKGSGSSLHSAGPHLHGVFPFVGAAFLFAAVTCLFLASMQPARLPSTRRAGEARGGRSRGGGRKAGGRGAWPAPLSGRAKLVVMGVGMLGISLVSLACGGV